ncbi:MAG TPA: Rid family detoxifying hydrolase [Miltoncostaeaceae bacterium]|nr:Rid family detoxifying hydrolase [Miltoncostaeaceae bacterium]
MRVIRTDRAPAPVAGAPYSQAIGAPVGETIYVSGQVPVDPSTGGLVSDDIADQTAMALSNLCAVVEAAGGRPQDIVRCTVFLTDLADFPAMNAVYGRTFVDRPPARSTVGVAALPLGARVEIDAIAVLPA